MRCAALSAALAEPAAGTAAQARFWVCLEQPGPWGAKAPTESHLDPGLGRALDTAVTERGGRLALIRHPLGHADHHEPGPRRVFVADTRPRRTYLLTGLVDEPAALLRLDRDALVSGDRDEVARSLGLEPAAEPVLLVCTNGRRDVCCALLGRQVATELARRGSPVWEANHLGGHRFAPTSVLLPWGFSHARLDAARADTVLAEAAAGRVPLDDVRGRSTWSSAAQAAEMAVRTSHGLTGLDDAVVRGEIVDGDRVTVEVEAGGLVHRVEMRRDTRVERPESCGKAPVPMSPWIPQA